MAAEKNPQIVNSTWGSGKTVTITVIAFALSKIKPEAQVLVALLNEAEAERMTKLLERQKLPIKKCLCYEDLGTAPDAEVAAASRQAISSQPRISITIHKVLAQFVYYGKKQELNKFYTFVDEVDRFSEKNLLAFRGSKEVMKLVRFFYGTSADSLTPEDQGPEGLDCPEETEFTRLGEGGNMNPRVIEIKEAGVALFKKLAVLAETRKLVLCAETVKDMDPVMKGMIKHGKIKPGKITTFDPESAHFTAKKKWQKINQLMENPELLDVVVTWAGGNRSHNYFAECLPVALFEFPEEKELHQLAGRSDRKGTQKFTVACVNNEDVKKRKERAEEAAKKLSGLPRRRNGANLQAAPENEPKTKKQKTGNDSEHKQEDGGSKAPKEN